MEQKIQDILPNLPHQMNIDYDYILTAEEEKNAIAHEISILKKTAYLKMVELKMHPEAIKLKLSSDDYFEEKLDKAEILKRYNVLKHRGNELSKKRIDRINEIQREKDELKCVWVYGKFFKVIRNHFLQKHGNFIFSETGSIYIKAICFFLSSNERFNTELGLDLRKGILVSSTTGVGKTETIKAVMNNPFNPISIYSMIDITDFVKKEGEFNLRVGNRIICLDDVGTEQPTVKHYGTEINWFKDFIETYYLEEHPFNKLIITTNLTGEQIEERYGKRVRSRMREMLNQIAFKGEDLRK